MPRKFMKRDSKDNKEKKKGRMIQRPRICRFCADRQLKIDFKDGRALSPFITERGRIVPRRISGNCATHQREVTLAVKRARILALVPFTATQLPRV
jgi:small subunit ribosomal protein S18